MKITSVIAYVVLALACDGFAGGPTPFPLERYESLLTRSAFSPATEGTSASTGADFAKDLVLTGVVRFNGGELVTLASRDQKRQFGLARGETRDGISIAGVAWSDVPGRTRVTLKKGAEFAVIGFDEAAIFAAPAVPSLQGQPPHPEMPSNAAPRKIVP